MIERTSLCSLPDPFTIVTWNIERGLQLKRIQHELGAALKADVLALQEVDRFARRTHFLDIAADLAQTTGMHQAFGVEFIELAQGRNGVDALHGNLTLSRAGLQNVRSLIFHTQPHDWGRIRLRLPWLQPRSGGRLALVSEIACGTGYIVVYNTHLESRANENERSEQIGEILKDVAATYHVSVPVIIAGDLNTTGGHGSVAVSTLLNFGFRDVFPPDCPPETTKPFRKRRLDWIFVRGLSALNAKVFPITISDHFPVVAQLQLNR